MYLVWGGSQAWASLQISPDDSDVQPGLRVSDLNIIFTEFLVLIPPWTWHCTEDTLRERSVAVSFSRGTQASVPVSKPCGIGRKKT